MRTIYEIIEELNQLLESLDSRGKMLPQEIEQWESIMMDYSTWEWLNREED